MPRARLLSVLVLVSLSHPAMFAANPVEILVISNRADLVSGGDALVEIKWPAGADVASGRVALNDTDVTSSFAKRPNGRYMGLVTGLRDGTNLLTARLQSAAVQLTITNHPIGGPVFSGAQLQPWICAAQTAKTVTVAGSAATVTTKVSGLGSDPIDDQCDARTVYTHYYRKASAPADCTFGVTGANACYTPYDPASMPPDADIAGFTNDRGATVKDLIRVERGAINRGIYTLVTPFDPRDANAPWAPPKGWNGKLVWEFGASASHSRFQTPPARGLFDASGGIGLRRGFMVATSSLTDHGTNSNDMLGAETMMMVKELIAERYGEIRYTIGDGCSGGSIKQAAIASAYPGLLDGIQPSCTYPDALTPFIEIPDCGDLQAHYYKDNPNGQALTPAQRNAINGHDNAGFCAAWIASFLPAMDPARAQNCAFPANFPLVFSKDNPKGIRCTALDHLASVLGTVTDAAGITRVPTIVDNVGVQYGLKALRDGVVSAEEFVRLNEGAGGYDGDLVWQTRRSSASPAALAVHYRTGLVSDGRQLARVPIIDLRGNQNPNGDIHANWRPYSVRDRLDRDAGGHANQVIWKFNSGGGAAAPGAALQRKAFLIMDVWLTAIEADRSSKPIEVKVRNNRPAAAVDFCLATTGANESDLTATLGLDDPACPVKEQSSPRQVAGGPRAENIYKCQLKPLDFNDKDYGGAAFSADQQARMKTVFPGGVCNWSVPGAGQAPASPWTTFAAGPGGKPLGPAPVSAALPRSAAPPAVPPGDALTATLQAAVDRGDVPGIVVMAATRDRVLYQGAFGKADAAAGRKMTMDALFAIASMTKPVTSAAAMQLVEQHKLSLDDPAEKYLPELTNLKVFDSLDAKTGAYTLRAPTTKVTVRQLFTHTSGLGYSFTSPITRDFKPRAGETYVDGPLLFDPGTQWMYGDSIGVLGRIVEKISGQTLEEYIREHILTPLKMVDTSFNVPEAKQPRRVTVHSRQDGRADAPLVERPNQPQRPVTKFNGGGGPFSTAGDYIRFERMILNGGTLGGARILSADSVAAMRRNQIGAVGVRALKTAQPALSMDFSFIDDGKDKWGLGFLITSAHVAGKRSAGSLSWGGIDNTYFWIDPQRGIAGVILMQFLPFADTKALAVYDAFERGVYQIAN